MIEGFDLTVDDQDNITSVLISFIKNQPGFVLQIAPGYVLYRCILYENKPQSFNDIIYPPKQFAKLNRANREGIQVFYAACNRTAALFEIGAKIGDTIAIGKWVFERSVKLANAGYSKINFSPKREIPMWGKFDDTSFNLEIRAFVMDYIAEKFSQQINQSSPYLYKLTVGIAEAIMRKEHIKGIIYPTIKLAGLNDNIVLKKSVIDSGELKFINVEWIKIIDIVGDTFVCDISDFAKEFGRDRFLYWKGGPGEWNTIGSPGWYFDHDEGGWDIVRDASGAIIEKS